MRKWFLSGVYIPSCVCVHVEVRGQWWVSFLTICYFETGIFTNLKFVNQPCLTCKLQGPVYSRIPGVVTSAVMSAPQCGHSWLCSLPAQHAPHQRSQCPTHDLFSTNNSLLSLDSSPLLPSSLVISFSYSLLPLSLLLVIFIEPYFCLKWCGSVLPCRHSFVMNWPMFSFPVEVSGREQGNPDPGENPWAVCRGQCSKPLFHSGWGWNFCHFFTDVFFILYSARTSEPGLMVVWFSEIFICCAPTKPSLWYSNLEMLLDHNFND